MNRLASLLLLIVLVTGVAGSTEASDAGVRGSGTQAARSELALDHAVAHRRVSPVPTAIPYVPSAGQVDASKPSDRSWTGAALLALLAFLVMLRTALPLGPLSSPRSLLHSSKEST